MGPIARPNPRRRLDATRTRARHSQPHRLFRKSPAAAARGMPLGIVRNIRQPKYPAIVLQYTKSGPIEEEANQTDPLIWTVIQYMNLRAQPPNTAGVCRVGLRLLLGLLPFMVAASPQLNPDPRWPTRSRPYLVVLGSSPLRIREASPPPDLSVHPPAGAPPQPMAEAPGHPGAIPPQTEIPTSAEATPQTIPSGTENPTVPAPEGKPTKPAKSILPDDTRAKVRAEDFLPFFQPPGANQNPNDVTVAPTPPAPGIQPPSSATYRQQ
jgi:hypothetical protein